MSEPPIKFAGANSSFEINGYRFPIDPEPSRDRGLYIPVEEGFIDTLDGAGVSQTWKANTGSYIQTLKWDFMPQAFYLALKYYKDQMQTTPSSTFIMKFLKENPVQTWTIKIIDLTGEYNECMECYEKVTFKYRLRSPVV